MLAISHTVFGLLMREDYAPRKTKSKSLIIAGAPNTGKTSILKALGKFLDPCIFYTVGNRKDDFTGFNIPDKPLII